MVFAHPLEWCQHENGSGFFSKEFHAVAQCLSWFASFTDPHSKVMNSVSWLGQLKVCKSIDIFDI